jgi:hypothetical protein
MNIDFHYYATYLAAIIAGYSHEESSEIAYSAQFVDCCTRTFLTSIKAPLSAATTQSQVELINARADLLGLQDITRIWSSFHFLPQDLYAEKKWCTRGYRNKYRLICGPNGDLLVETVKLAKGKSLESVGLAMHVLADTWAHRNFAGTPSLVINNTNYYFYEIFSGDAGEFEKKITFRHSTSTPDDLNRSIYTNSLFQTSENSIMNLGHGRAGHLPDYSFIKYKYLPAWGDFTEIVKDNPSDYYHAFCQMVYAMRYLRGNISSFGKDTYDFEIVSPYEAQIKEIINKRQIDSCADWKALGEKISGNIIDDFDVYRYKDEYLAARKEAKDNTILGRFFVAALRQKSMVTNKIYKSGNMLAGFSADFAENGFVGIKDFKKLVDVATSGGEKHD